MDNTDNNDNNDDYNLYFYRENKKIIVVTQFSMATNQQIPRVSMLRGPDPIEQS